MIENVEKKSIPRHINIWCDSNESSLMQNLYSKMILHLNPRRIVMIDGRGRLISCFVSLFSRKMHCHYAHLNHSWSDDQNWHHTSLFESPILFTKKKRNSHANVPIKTMRLNKHSIFIIVCLLFSISCNYFRYHFVVQFDNRHI